MGGVMGSILIENLTYLQLYYRVFKRGAYSKTVR